MAEDVRDGEVSFDYFLNESIQSNYNFSLTNEQEVIDITNSFSSTSPGSDDVPIKIIKTIIDKIASPLSHIYNSSILGGVFPDNMKTAKIIPIYNKGDTSDLKNYRPISILTSFSKIFEKIIYVRLLQYLDEFDILNDSQYGFRCGRSTCDAILKLTDHILQEFDKKCYSIAVFLDLKKAFETVNHSILLQKLASIGLSDLAICWFQSYLTGRKQYVKFKNSLSDYKFINHSVPQSSNLDPVLFIIYINDIINSLSFLKPILFADDSCFFCSGENLNQIIDKVNTDLIMINNWISANELTLNIEKSHYVVFNRKKKVPPDIGKLFITNNELSRVNSTIFLGITLCDNLSW